MANRTWDEDEEAIEWARRRKESSRESLSCPKDHFPVQLVCRDMEVVLNRKEWRSLQYFLDKHEKNIITREDYQNLPAKVRTVIHDWRKS